MRTISAVAQEFSANGLRLDASFYASSGVQTMHLLEHWKQNGKQRKFDKLADVCESKGIFIPGRFSRMYVSDPKHGLPWLSPSDMLNADLSGVPYVSKKYTPIQDVLRLQKGWLLLSRSGSIGNLAYVRDDMVGMIGSDDIIRISPNEQKVPRGYLYAFLSSSMGKALIQQQTYGAVIQHIEVEHIVNLPIPRLDSTVEEQIHALVEQAATLRVKANALLKESQGRFYHEVLGFNTSRLKWKAGHVDAFAIGKTQFNSTKHRLDAFHYVGYTGEAEAYLPKTQPMGDLVEPYQPPMFKRPYTGENGIPFLSGIDLYDAYPKPHMYISRKMERLDLYIVDAGTILVQNVGQRYGLFGRPTILPKYLDNASVTQHMMRVYPKNSQDRGFVYIWLATEIGRRLLLKESFGTSMGVLFERSFKQMTIPVCQIDLRHSFEIDVQTICEMRDKAIELEDQAQELLTNQLKK